MITPITGRAYSEHNTQIAENIGPVTKTSCKNLAIVYMISMKNHMIQVIDVGVSVDGSWMKRGYLSNYGVVAAISCETGEILDFKIMSKLCDKCKTTIQNRNFRCGG